MGARSEGGHYLGVLTRGKTHRGEITFGDAGAAKSDWDSDLTPFLDNHALKRLPFVFVVDDGDATFDTPTYLKMLDDGDEPYRNSDCKQYTDCLDLAVENKWPGFSCGGCRFGGGR